MSPSDYRIAALLCVTSIIGPKLLRVSSNTFFQGTTINLNPESRLIIQLPPHAERRFRRAIGPLLGNWNRRIRPTETGFFVKFVRYPLFLLRNFRPRISHGIEGTHWSFLHLHLMFSCLLYVECFRPRLPHCILYDGHSSDWSFSSLELLFDTQKTRICSQAVQVDATLALCSCGGCHAGTMITDYRRLRHISHICNLL
ncbi:hypothetical protein L218DRAFT_102872 [Marasmius fiardii PR-910]|nr:hypothetical protein L218DRAFT_102872 [Marasmius fiardii PR-910]